MNDKPKTKWSVIIGPLVFLAIFLLIFSLFVRPMGLVNTRNTLMNTAYHLLIDTSLYIMAIAVLAGAISALFTEFGVIDFLNRLLSPLLRPLFGMPGAAALGVVTTYLSDNPAILTLADDKGFRRYFKAYQIPALTNIGTSFGMGLIVTTFVLGLGGVVGTQVGLAAPDVSIQAQVINLLNELREELGLSSIFIAHDLSVVKYFSDRIIVMYFGRIVEIADADELFAHPLPLMIGKSCAYRVSQFSSPVKYAGRSPPAYNGGGVFFWRIIPCMQSVPKCNA